MKKQNERSIELIRRSVAESFKSLQSLFADEAMLGNARPLRFESLEDRRVLSATGFEPAVGPAADTAIVTTDFDNSANEIQTNQINSILIDVNGEQFELTDADSMLQLVAGDTIQVVDISFHSSSSEGVFAAEGYVNKIGDLSSASLIDYNDGRFSERAANQAATGGDGAIGGLSDAWTVDSGWDRLTLNLMHYTESNTEVANRFFIGLQVGQPDFEFDTAVLDQVTEQEVRVNDAVEIPARWLNNLAGQFHNYAEVDIYHSSNMEEVVWAGAVVGNADGDNSVSGDFRNTRGDFTEQFTPSEEGEYVLKYYLDPEAINAESNEDNNEYEIRLNVLPELTPEAVDDSFDSNLDSLDVLQNDTPVDESDELTVAEYSQGEHGKVSLNDDGTLNYTPEDGFVGTDEFTYSVTDGDTVSETASVSVTVEDATLFEVSDVQGDEDQSIRLEIETDFDKVQISGVPEGAELNKGKFSDDGTYEVKRSHLKNLKIQPAANSDADFQLTVTPIIDGEPNTNLSQTIDVTINAVVDGGELQVRDFGIMAGSEGSFPARSYFDDLDGSETHVVNVTGLPEFMSLSAGQQNADLSWTLSAEDLVDLQIASVESGDTSDWQNYRGQYVFKLFNVSFSIESFEAADPTNVQTFTGSFKAYAWQNA